MQATSTVISSWKHLLQNLFNPLTPGAFAKNVFFWTFWRFSAWKWAKLALIYLGRHLQHGSMPFFSLAPCFATFSLWHAQKWKVWDFWTRKWLSFWYFFSFFVLFLFLFFLSFCCRDWPCTGLASSSKNSEKASSRGANFTMELPRVVESNFAPSFTSNFWVFSWIFQAPLSWSLWSDKIIGKVISWYRTWVQMMPILVKDDDVRSETKVNARHSRDRSQWVK